MSERDAELRVLRAENERHRKANLVRAVTEGYDGWITEAINAEDFDRVPWLIAENLRAENETLRAIIDRYRERMALVACFPGCGWNGEVELDEQERWRCPGCGAEHRFHSHRAEREVENETLRAERDRLAAALRDVLAHREAKWQAWGRIVHESALNRAVRVLAEYDNTRGATP